MPRACSHWAILGLALATAATARPSEATAPVVQGDLGRKLDAYLSRLEALGYSGGLAVVKGGETVLLKGYGQADRERGVPMRRDECSYSFRTRRWDRSRWCSRFLSLRVFPATGCGSLIISAR